MGVKECSVYGLTSSRDDRIRYVGQTIQPLKIRLAQHVADSTLRKYDTRCFRWIRKEVSGGYKINIQVIESDCVLHESEIKWIAYYKAIHSDLTNTSIGGDFSRAGIKESEAQCAKKRHPNSEQGKKNKSYPKSESAKKNMSLAQIGNIKGIGEKNGKAKLNSGMIIEIRNKLNMGLSLAAIASEYEVQKAAIWKIKEGLSWSHV